jgi:hypothetical protein
VPYHLTLEEVGPHVVIAGFARSGTTLLAQLMADQENIRVVGLKPPEPKSLLNWQGDLLASSQHYREIFEPYYGNVIRVEKSTSYSDHLHVIHLMRRLLPNALIVFVIRDPIERILSNYRWSCQSKMETRSLTDAIYQLQSHDWSALQEPRPHDYLWRSLYGNHLKAWLRYWPRNQIHIVQLEKLTKDPRSTLASLANFIGFDFEFKADINLPKVNATDHPNETKAYENSETLRLLSALARGPLARDQSLLADMWPQIEFENWNTFNDLRTAMTSEKNHLR